MGVMLFFLLYIRENPILVHWWIASWNMGSHPNKETGMWKVGLHLIGCHQLTTVIHLDSFLQGAHLLLIFGEAILLPVDFHFSYSLDVFKAYFVNKYANDQMYKLCS